MLTLQGIVTGGALIVSILALLTARRAVRRLERLTESYWELRYESGQLKARVTRVETTGLGNAEEEARPEAQPSFVPLSSLKSPSPLKK